MTRLLLHVCCGPCSTEVIERLSRDYELTLFFFNPNIDPGNEYVRRLEEARRYAESRGIEFVKGDHDHGKWLQCIKGLENEPEGGLRCAACFGLRLTAAASLAKERGIGLFTTTLTIGPHKNARTVNDIGLRAAGEAGVDFLQADFKKRDGFKRSLHLSKEAGMYRQDYCGCEFSRRPGKV